MEECVTIAKQNKSKNNPNPDIQRDHWLRKYILRIYHTKSPLSGSMEV